MQENIGTRLRRLRTEKNLKINDLAKKIGVAPSTLRDWEYGRAIKGEPYLALANALDVSLSFLLTGKSLDSLAVQKAVNLIEDALKILKNDGGSFE